MKFYSKNTGATESNLYIDTGDFRLGSVQLIVKAH